MAKISFDGLDKLQRDLKKMEQNARKLNGRREVPLKDLFTTAFMRKHTRFLSLDALLKAGGFHVAFDEIPRRELDSHIAKVTKFKSWDDLLDAAITEYAMNQLGF